MNRNDELIGLLEGYLDAFDGDTPLPSHVRDAVRAELPRTRQVRARPRPLEVLTMLSRSSAVGLATAASVGVAVVLGVAVLNGGGLPLSGGRPDTTATPAPSASTSPSPSPSPSPASGGVPLGAAPAAVCGPESQSPDCIAAGTYTLGTAWPATIGVDVPTGWFSWLPAGDFSGMLVDSGADAPSGSGWGIVFSQVDSVYRDPCDGAAGSYDPTEVDTPEELAAAIAAWPGFTATTPEGISVDGADGLLFTLSSTRTDADCAEQIAWTTPSGWSVDAYPMVGDDGVRNAATFRILDLGQGLVVIRTTEFVDASPHERSQGVAADSSRHAADLVQLQAMVDSITIEPSP